MNRFTQKTFSSSGLFALFISLLTVCVLIVGTGCDRFSRGQEGTVEVRDGKLVFQKFGKGDPIVVVHGARMDHNYLLPHLLDLAKDHEVVFYDQRGSGKSLETKLDRSHINIDQFVRDLEALRVKLGHEKMTLIGHSWGGFLAMHYTLVHPQKVKALILMSSAPADYRGQKAFIDELGRRTASMQAEFTAINDINALRKMTPKEISQLYAKVSACGFADPAKLTDMNFTQEMAGVVSGAMVMTLLSKTSWMLPSINLFPKLRRLTVPTLVIHGKQDFVPIETAEKIKTAIPNAQGMFLDNCGHYPFVEQPQQMFETIRAFLGQIQRPA